MQDVIKRVLHIIAGLGGDCTDLLDSTSLEQKAISWDRNKTLKFVIPFREINTELILDNLLPRVLELAENSPDRKIKVAAGELLHSITLFMIGKSAEFVRDPTLSEIPKSPFHKIYLKVFPVILRLAVDVDKVTRNLFNLLAFQLIHWLTKNQVYENPETMAMLSSCLDAATSTDGPLRDFGAECSAEFLKYSIKHSSGNVHQNAKSLFKRLYLYCQHSSSTKRLGASLTFCRLYRMFREEAELVDLFTFEILYNLFFSLRIASEDNVELGTKNSCTNAINHFAKIVEVKYTTFLKATAERREFPGLVRADLPSLVEWLLVESGRSEVEYAHLCMELFFRFTTKIAKPQVWLNERLKEKSNLLEKIYEPQKLIVKDTNTIYNSQTKLWMDQLCTSLDGYTFLLEADIITAQPLLNNIQNGNSRMTRAIQFFIQNYGSKFTPTELPEFDSVTPSELSRLHDCRAAVITKMFLYIEDLLLRDKVSAPEKLGKFWDEDLFRLIAYAVFNPSELGFNSESEEVKSQLGERMVNFIKVLKEVLEPRDAKVLYKCMANICFVRDQVWDMEDKQWVEILEVVNGQILLLECKILENVVVSPVSKYSSYDVFVSDCVKRLKALKDVSDPMQLMVAGTILKLCLSDSRSTFIIFVEFLNIPANNKTTTPDTFLKSFGTYILPYIYRNWENLVEFFIANITAPMISVILQQLFDYITLNKVNLKDTILLFMDKFTKNERFLDAFSKHYMAIGNYDVLMTFWKQITLLDRHVVHHSGEKFVDILVNVYCEFLDVKVPLNTKIGILDILPTFLEGNEKVVERLETKLHEIRDNQFPLSASELTQGTTIYKDYMITIEKLINSIEATESTVVIQVLLLHLCRDETHKLLVNFRRSVESASQKFSASVFGNFMLFLMNLVQKDEYPADFRKNLSDNVLSPCLVGGQEPHVQKFFVANIAMIMTKTREDLSRKIDDLRTQLIMKSVYWDLVQICYMRLTPQEINSDEGAVAMAYAAKFPPPPAKPGKPEPKKGQQLTKDVIKYGSDSAKELTPPDDPEDVLKLRLAYHQAAYSATASAIQKTQNQVAFFHAFLFKAGKGQILYENIVDIKTTHRLEPDLDRPLLKTRLEQFRSRSSLAQSAPKKKATVSYLSSQYLADSSLSQTVSFYGDRQSQLQNVNPMSEGTLSNFLGSVSTNQIFVFDMDAIGETDIPSKGSLDLDEFNKNTCMKTMMNLIEYLHQVVSPPQAAHGKPIEMPSWMNELFLKMMSKDTHINVRLFIGKIIVNLPDAFRPYASHWWRPVASLIGDGALFGLGINYYIQDLCTLLISWCEESNGWANAIPTASDREILFSMIKYIISNAPNSSPSFMNNNVKILQIFLEKWKEHIVIPTDIIYSHLQSQHTATAGIYILSAILVNKIDPFNFAALGDSKITENSFFTALVAHLSSKEKKIYLPCSIVTGQSLSHLSASGSTIDLETKVHEQINIVKNSFDAKQLPIFITVLQGISQNYPAAVTKYVSELLFKLPNLPDPLRALCLQIFAACSEYVPLMFAELKSKNLLGIIRHRHDECQAMVLVALLALVPTLTEADISYFLEAIVQTFVTHANEKCRQAFYALILKIVKRNDLALQSSDLSRLHFAVFQGLNDPLDEIRTSFQHFLNTEKLSLDVKKRLLELFTNWYMIQVEEPFLLHGVAFLLELSHEAPQYNEKLFNHGLPTATFNDKPLAIDLSYTQRSSVQPLFAPTQSLDMNMNVTAVDGVKATQQVEWTPTLDIDISTARSIFSFTQSDVPGSGTLSLSRSSKTPVETLRKRQYKQRDGMMSSIYFAKQAEREKIKTQRQASRQREARTRQVTLNRQYREGELPDIEILNREILDPLQILSRRDPETAIEVMRTLCVDIMEKVLDASIVTEEESAIFSNALKERIQKIFSQTSGHFPPFIRAALLILYSVPLLSPDSSSISEMAMKSNNTELGALLLEKLIEYESNKSEPRKKKIKTDIEMSPWTHLANMYKDMCDFEIYQNLFDYKITTNDFTRDALNAEILGDYGKAWSIYNNALNQSGQDYEVNLWVMGSLECMSKLGDWDSVIEGLEKEVNSPNNIWESSNRDIFLDHYVRSHIRLADAKDKDEGRFKDLVEFVKDSLNYSERRELLEKRYSAELSLSALLQGDFNQAKHYTGTFFDSFRKTFSSISTLAYESRLSALSTLPRGKDLQEFVDLVSDSNAVCSRKKIQGVLDRWKNRYPKRSHSINVWDDMVSTRCRLLDLLIDVLSNRLRGMETLPAEILPLKEAELLLKYEKQNYMLELAKASLHHHNLGFTTKILSLLSSNDASGLEDVEYLQWKLEYQNLTSNYEGRDDDEDLSQCRSMSMFIRYIHTNKIQKKVDAFSNPWRASFETLRSRVYDAVTEILMDSTELGNQVSEALLSSEHQKGLARLCQSLNEQLPTNRTSLAQVFVKGSFNSVQTATELNSCDKALFQFAQHCDQVLRWSESGNKAAEVIDKLDYAEIVIKNTLEGMMRNIPEALQMFPRLLQLLDMFPGLSDVFVKKSENIPIWMFIRWIPQLTAILDKPTGMAVFPILVKMARKYPNALYFPFAISNEQYVLKDSSQEKNRQMISQLKDILKSEKVENLIRELSRLTEPQHIMKDWLERADMLLKAGSRDELLEIFKQLFDMLLDTRNSSKRMGLGAVKFAKAHGQNLTNIFGTGGSKIKTMTMKDLKAAAVYYDTKIKPEKLASGGEALLKNYSPWLTNYQSRNYDDLIEMPGQYDGLSRPRPQNHVKIASFYPHILVMSSMRRPKRLTIIGTDEKEYMWLIKGGEDLRLDQRVEQIFQTMNGVLKKNAYCSQRKMFVQTYKVVPMSITLGVIEWVPNTKPLRGCMSEHPNFNEQNGKATGSYNKFIASYAKGDLMKGYGVMMAKREPRELYVKNMNHQWKATRDSYLKEFFLKLCAFPDAFVTVRSQFAHSLAALNICSYILGIGDRHTDNFLVDLGSGRIIGIDFGHAFGSATEILPIPELVPFRLTKQIELLMEPLGIAVLMQVPMMNTLKALQEYKGVILNAMDIFAKEPLIEWRTFAINQAKKMKIRGRSQESQSMEIDESSITAPAWYPTQKIEIAKRKLNGDNPAYITSEELRNGHEEKPFFKNMNEVLMGDKSYNIRAQIGSRCKNVKEQVECLVDQATDPAILGRAWVGWSPWL